MRNLLHRIEGLFHRRSALPVTLLLGIILGFAAARRPAGDGSGGLLSDIGLPTLIRQASADLEEGDYEFFPNRRSIWIVNRSNGRMANYYFHDDELGSVDRSRVATIDTKTFPKKDTVIHLSDRNYNNILWVCNTRTGDVQMWHPGRDGVLRSEQPITSSIDLMERAQ